MTAQEATIAKIRQLPEPLAREVSDFVDFLPIGMQVLDRFKK